MRIANAICIVLTIYECFEISHGRDSPPNGRVRAVNLGGWLVLEEWITPSIFSNIPVNKLRDGSQIQLKSVTLQKYVCAENGGGANMVVNRDQASGWETFKLWRLAEPTLRFQFRVSNNQFMVAENGGGGSVNANRDTPQEWETFRIITDPNSDLNSQTKRVHIQAYNGMYLQAKDTGQLTADFSGEPGWDNNPTVFELTVISQLGGEYQLANGYGNQASKVLKRHWYTFITKNDFAYLACNKVNAVRIPVGWWIRESPAPFIAGSLQMLDNAFAWARQYKIQIIIDLHAAPGSQNTEQHCGTRDGVSQWADTNKDYVNQTLDIIEFLAERYASNSVLLGIGLLNEPSAASVPLDILENYYDEGYKRVRKHSGSAYVIIDGRIGSSSFELLNFADNGYNNMVLDLHFYNVFGDDFTGRSVQWHIDFIRNDRTGELSALQQHASIFVGEWVNEMNVAGASAHDYQNFGAIQLEVYGKATFGWAYWTLKTETAQYKHWNFLWTTENGLLAPSGNGSWP